MWKFRPNFSHLYSPKISNVKYPTEYIKREEFDRIRHRCEQLDLIRHSYDIFDRIHHMWKIGAQTFTHKTIAHKTVAHKTIAHKTIAYNLNGK